MISMSRVIYCQEHAVRLRADARRRSIFYRALPGYQERANRNQRLCVARARIKVLVLLGDVCKKCGETDVRTFQIDHVNGGGDLERRKFSARQIYRKIINNPTSRSDYQILCANCNLRKENIKRSDKIIKLKLEAIIKFGGCCVDCNESDEVVLQFHHVNSDGSIHRRLRSTIQIFKDYLKGLYNIQLLCANCHQIRKLQEVSRVNL